MSPSFRTLFLAALFLLPLAAARAEEPVRVVATGGRIGYTFHPKTGGAAFAFWQRTLHVLGGPVSELQVGLMDWMYPSSGAETPNSADLTVTHVWFERAATGQVVPVAFGGARQLLLPANSTTPVWLSDPIPSSVWTGPAPARDEIFWLHVKGTVPEGGRMPVGTPSRYHGAKGITYPIANDTGAVDLGGPPPAIAGSAALNEGLPLVVLGRFTGPGHLAVIGIGDSILNGSGDSSAAGITGFGFFNRAALDADGAGTIAMFNLTRHGQTASSWTTPSRQTRQSAFLPFANVVVEEYGTNDLGQDGTGDPAKILPRLETIWSTVRAAGVQKIVRTLLMPRTTSTDDWKTLAAQTPRPGWGAGEKRDQINAGLRAALAAGKVDAIVDSLAVLADPADDTRWLSNGAADYTTTDGTHVAPTGNAMMAVALRAALLSLTVDQPGPLTYTSWSEGFDWAGADPAPEADPNADGVGNLLAYALALSPVAPAGAGDLPAIGVAPAAADGPWLAFTYRENTRAADLVYTVQASPDLAAWSALAPDGVDVVAEVADADPDGDGGAIERRVRIRLDAAAPRRFLRLQVSR